MPCAIQLRRAKMRSIRNDSDYAATKLSPDSAGQIAEDEIAKLQQWLEKQWNSTPRDTAMIEKLLKLLPGGQQLSKWSEAAPYLLTIVVATHHAFFGHIDLLILGGWSLATWLTEKLSNQVASPQRAGSESDHRERVYGTSRASAKLSKPLPCLARTAITDHARYPAGFALLADRISESLQNLFPFLPRYSGGGQVGRSSIGFRGIVGLKSNLGTLTS